MAFFKKHYLRFYRSAKSCWSNYIPKYSYYTTAVFFKLKCYYTTLEHTAKAFGIEIKGQDELDYVMLDLRYTTYILLWKILTNEVLKYDIDNCIMHNNNVADGLEKKSSYLCTIWREYKISLEMDKVQKSDFRTTGIT